MEKYKENTINKDIFYEEQKREKLKEAAIKARDNEPKIEEKLDEPDPWMNSKFKSSKEAASTEVEEVATEGAETEEVATEGAATNVEVGSTEVSDNHKIL